MNYIDSIFGKWKRKRECNCHFGNDDIIIQNYRLNAVHEFPQKTQNGWEITFNTETGVYKHKLEELELDFYLDTNKDIYILRIQDKPENIIIFLNREIVTNKIIPMTYIIVRKKITENISEELDKIIGKLQEINFPKYHEEKIYEIGKWE